MKKIFLVLVMLFVFSGLVYAESVSLSWNANTESDLAGYKVYYGNSTGNYDNSFDIGNQLSHTLENLAVGQSYYIALTAYDIWGNESGYSNEVSYTATDTTPPGSPVNLKIIIIVQ